MRHWCKNWKVEKGKQSWVVVRFSITVLSSLYHQISPWNVQDSPNAASSLLVQEVLLQQVTVVPSIKSEVKILWVSMRDRYKGSAPAPRPQSKGEGESVGQAGECAADLAPQSPLNTSPRCHCDTHNCEWTLWTYWDCSKDQFNIFYLNFQNKHLKGF